MPTAIPTATMPPSPPPGPIINYFVAHGNNLNPGDCTSISWSVSNAREVYFDGRGVEGTGAAQVCPRQTTTYTLRVVALDGSVITRTVTITVTAGCTQLKGNWGGATNAVYAAANNLASAKGICSGQIQVVSVESVQWRDSSLGCPERGKVYAFVITPGYKILLQTGSGRFEYHTNQDGGMLKTCNSP
jgi:hypothetical protein